MSDSKIKDQIQNTNTELRRRIELLEEMMLEKERLDEALKDSEKRYRRLFESAKDGILILNADTGKIVDVNPFLMDLLGYSLESIIGKHIWELGIFKDIITSKDAFKTLKENKYIRYEDLPLETNDGQPVDVEFVSNVYTVDHSDVIQCNICDITDRKRSEAERNRLQAAIEQTGEAIVMTDTRGIIQFVNPAFERITGYTREEVIGRNSSILKSGEQTELFYRDLWNTISSGNSWAGRIVNKRKDGTLYSEEATISPVHDASGRIVNYVAVKRDITENLRLASQFQQAQKMEAVGLLAGGVAHDYNNMLNVILGYTELALEKVDPALPLHADLKEILKAAKRSTDITSQLLAFARKQPISPVVLDLNWNIEVMLKMLRQLIGENIDLIWLPEGSPCLVKMDPVQIGQILANLCVNARDAIADVGKITIETSKAVFDEIYCAHHPGSVPGKYVMLTIRDDGCGMEKGILDQIFEPFFTSKEIDQGSGLGLSSVYGIVKQNNGFIDVDSEPGKGSTFRIYLPLSAGKIVDARREKTSELPRSHGETILVVEDEPALLALDKTMLEKLGYRVLTAGTPSEAFKLAEEHINEINLLITDVIMPEMNGQKLAQQLQSLYPGIKVLFISGYSSDVINHQGDPDKDLNFIQKPFFLKDLAAKVRDALEEK